METNEGYWTTGDIARQHDVSLWAVTNALQRMRMKPAMWAGAYRLFTADQVVQIVANLNPQKRGG